MLELKMKNKQDRTQVVILGSAPGAEFPDGDAIYCANSAAVAHFERVRSFSDSVSVVGDHIVERGYDPAPTERHKHARRFIEICNLPTKKIVVIRQNRYVDPAYPFERGLAQLQERVACEIEVTEASERRALIARITGLQEPIWNPEIYNFIPPNSLRRKITLRWTHIRAKLRSVLDNTYSASPKFRLSCGLYCLALAIETHGQNADYHVAGIRLGLDANRDEYAAGDYWSSTGMPAHLLVDRLVLPLLAQRYKISIDEPFI
jgi:hypothetical protein